MTADRQITNHLAGIGPTIPGFPNPSPPYYCHRRTALVYFPPVQQPLGVLMDNNPALVIHDKALPLLHRPLQSGQDSFQERIHLHLHSADKNSLSLTSGHRLQ